MCRCCAVLQCAAFVVFTLFSPVTLAQTYERTERAEPYRSLAERGATVAPVTFSERDEGTAVVTLPFAFQFFGAPQTELLVSVNGNVRFGGGGAPSFNNVGIGDASAPDGIVAVWWDDLIMPEVDGHARTAVIGTAPERAFVIEVEDWERFGLAGLDDGAYQLWLYEGPLGRFEIAYGRSLTAAEDYSATVGYRSLSATEVDAFRPCGLTEADCDATDYESLTDRVVSVGLVDAPELTGTVGDFGRGAAPLATVDIPISVGNRGPRVAGASRAVLYLSADAAVDPADWILGSIAVGALASGQVQTTDVAATVPAGTPPGDYLLLLQLDEDGVVAEADESNNVVASANRFATAADLVPRALAGPMGATAGEIMSLGLTIDNAGLPFVGSVAATVKLSPDPINDLADPEIDSQTIVIGGAASQSVTLDVQIPPGVSQGLYFPIVILDPDRQIPETSDGNNVAVASQPVRVGPDFRVSAVAGPTQGAPGDTVSITTTIDSIGASYAGPVAYTVFMSLDESLDAQDIVVGTFVADVAGPGASDTRSVALPPGAVGDFVFAARVDPAGQIAEADESNNEYVDGVRGAFGADLRLFSPAFTPDAIDRDGAFDYTATLVVDTNAIAATVAYRVLLSVDGTLDAADREVAAGTIVVNGQGNFPIAGTADLSMAQPPVAPGEYDVIVEVDPGDAIAERREDNNDNDSFGVIRLRGPNLAITGLISASEAFAGESYEVTIALVNNGDAEASTFDYAYYIGEQGGPAGGVLVGAGSVVGLGPGETIQRTDRLPLPAGLTLGAFQFGVVIDSGAVVEELNELDNQRLREGGVLVRAPVADLSAQVLQASSTAAPGETVSVTSVLRNLGFIGATDFGYAYALVPPVGPQIVVDRRRLALASGARVRRVDSFVLPPAVAPGTYRLDLIADPDDELEEVDETNNRGSGFSIEVFGGDLEIATAELPEARIAVPYETRLTAVGGEDAKAWRVAQGALPAGLILSPDGRLSGTTTTEGDFSFTAEVSSGGRSAQRALVVRVRSAAVPLAVATVNLPNALLGRPYRTAVVAVGGRPPVTWTATGLPPGVFVDAAGMLHGTPTTIGLFDDLELRVTDSIGSAATAIVALRVIDPAATVRISTAPLPLAVVDVPYCATTTVRLFASGGVGPYAWSASGLPLGLSLSSEGALCGTPSVVGRFSVLVSVVDAIGQLDTTRFGLEVRPGDDLIVRTTALPSTTVGETYDVLLDAAGGRAPYTWAADAGGLPAGLSLSTGGRIFGQPSAVGLYAFAVRVTDASGASVRRALSVEVAAAANTTDESDGCRCVTQPRPNRSAYGFVVALLAFAVLRRKRC